jgi:lysophospholipase L1-like esterase
MATVLASITAACAAASAADASNGGTEMNHKDPMAGVKRIVFTGNSLTDGSAWCDWVVETLQANGYPNLILFNAGVAGNDTPRLKARYWRDVLAVKPDLVVVNIGSIDGRPPEDYRRDLGEMVAATRQTGCKMILMTPAPIRDAKRNELPASYAPVVRELARTYDCIVADTQAAFAAGAAAGKTMWGPDGVHHTIEGWRALARITLDALGCHAPIVEKTSIYHNALTEWFISPPLPWKPAPVNKQWTVMPEDFDPVAAAKGEYPPLPEIKDGFDPIAAGWRKFDREAEIGKTSWWQVSWLARGGIMPMGQEVIKDKPGAASRDAGAFSLAIVRADAATNTTMHVGGSLPYAVWLNGKLVWNGSFLHGYHPSADRFPIALRNGGNHILVFCNWLFYVSLGDI